MIKLFNTNHPSVYLSLLGLSLLSRFSLLADDAGMLESSFYPINDMGSAFGQFRSLWWLGDALLALINGVIINFLLIHHEIVPRKTHLPAAIFVLSSAVLIPGLGAFPMLLTVLFLAFSTVQLSSLTNNSNLVSGSFFSGAFIGLASIVTSWASIFLIHSLLGIRLAKGSNVKMWMLQLLGFGMMIYFFWTGFFLFNHGFSFIENYLSGFRFSLSHVVINYNALPKMGLVVVALLAITSTLTVFGRPIMRNVTPRGWMVYWLGMGATFVLVGLLLADHRQAFSIALIPISATLTLFLLIEKRKALRNVLFLVFILTVIAQQVLTMRLFDFPGNIY